MTLISPALLATALALGLPSSALAITRLDGTDLAKDRPASVVLADSPRGTVVVFLSARCPCSASHETRLRELASTYEARGFRFVGVHANADEDAAMARAHFRESALPFPVIQDERARLADALGALKTPHVFVLNARGETIFQGGVDDSHVAASAKHQYLGEALEAIAAGREPPRKEVRALGCIIQRP